MTALFRALPAALALVRWRILGRDGALAALLVWVALTDAARYLLIPHLGDSPAPWALVDCLWASWYCAHVLVLTCRPAAVQLAGATMATTAVMAVHYLTERWMKQAALREIWLGLAGGSWSLAGIIAWNRQPVGLGQALGLLSAVLSLVQVVNIFPSSLVWITPAIGYSVASIALAAGFIPYFKRKGEYT